MDCGPKQTAGLGNREWHGIQTQPAYTILAAQRAGPGSDMCLSRQAQPVQRAGPGCRYRGGIQTWAVHTTILAQWKKEQITTERKSAGTKTNQVHINPTTQRAGTGK